MTGVNVVPLVSSSTTEFDANASYGDINVSLMVREHAPRKREQLLKKKAELLVQLSNIDTEVRFLDDLLDVIERHG